MSVIQENTVCLKSVFEQLASGGSVEVINIINNMLIFISIFYITDVQKKMNIFRVGAADDG